MNRSGIRKVSTTACRIVQAPVLAKRIRQIFASMFIVLLLGPSVQAKTKTGDWRAVENLRIGTYVIVKAQHKYACTVEGANEDQLVCWVHLPRSFHTISLAFPRAEIREVRALPNQAKDAWIGAGIGGAAGAVAAGTNSRDYPGLHAFVGGLAGAGAGALVGATVPIFQIIFHRGIIIYKG